MDPLINKRDRCLDLGQAVSPAPNADANLFQQQWEWEGVQWAAPEKADCLRGQTLAPGSNRGLRTDWYTVF